MIDWAKLEPYGSSNYKSFEELCYQIAKGLYDQEGKFTSIDDSGGGDGVEFYLTLPDGDQWGWQAKFYYPLPRLSHSSRKASIEGSLEKACLMHPNLTKWFLCTPTNFTVDEQSWFNETLSQNIPSTMTLELIHWSDSDFNTWLSKPKLSGIRNYFFSELELNVSWFKNQVEKQISLITDKFNHTLHVETNIDLYIHMLLGDEEFAEHVQKGINILDEYYSEFSQYLHQFIQYSEYGVEAGSSPGELIKAIKDFEMAFNAEVEQLKRVCSYLVNNQLDNVKTFGWKDILKQVDDSSKHYWEVSENFDLSKLILEEGKDEKKEHVGECIRKFGWFVDSVLFKLRKIPEECVLIKQSEMHIFGDAGFGKTHIASHIACMFLEKNLPALFALGVKFTTDRTLEEQLRGIYDIPPRYSWSDFLQALDTAGEVYKTRIPIIIDGLNESTNNGTFSGVWRLGLPGLIKEISTTRNIVMITTCRTSYKDEIWGSNLPKNVYYTRELSVFDTKLLIQRYFDWYKIKADMNSSLLRQFKHPLYLKIFCECKNQSRDEEVQVYIGDQTIFEIFDEYIQRCNRTICERNGLYPKLQVVWPAFEKVAQYLWDNCRRSIPISGLFELVDGQSGKNLKWNESTTRMILDEGLVNRDWGKAEEEVLFTYDLLGGYIIASYLFNKSKEDIISFINSKDTEDRLLSDRHKRLHPLYSDIRRCLLAICLIQLKIDPDAVVSNNVTFDLLVNAIFEVSAESIDDKYIKLIEGLFNIKTNRNRLLELAENTLFHEKHPLNITFWSRKLKELSMAERDISWTEYVRYNYKRIEDYLDEIEFNCRENESNSPALESRLHSVAEYVMWVLTSSVRPLRDKATKALYWYGRSYPNHFFRLLKYSFEINDPYISERMLAAIYGITMAKHNDFTDKSFQNELLPFIGRSLYELIFAIKAPYNTTHILAKDYARNTIEITILHHPKLLSEKEKVRIRPSSQFDEIREWGESGNRDKDKYSDGNAPIHMDFENYTIGRLVKDRSNYDFKNSEYKKVRANIFWRIYDLGYSLDVFGEIDKEIARKNIRYGRSNDGGKTDRYGKKYSWIAFFELAGLRENNGLMKELYEGGRIPDADIDPSFPEKENVFNFVTDDFLGDRNTPIEEWIKDGGCPDMSNYLTVDGLCGEAEQWVLLDGYINQEDGDFNRSRFIFPRALIVKSEECSEIVRMLEKQDLGGRWLPEIPRDYYLYAGEIPWSELYLENELSQLVFMTEYTEVTNHIKHAQLFKKNIPLSEQDERIFWQSLSDRVCISGDIKISMGKEDAEVLIKKALKEQGLQLKEIKKELKEKKPVKKIFDILIPVRENQWESYHSSINPGRHISVPCRQITKELDLCGQPQTFDLYEKDGRRASITIEYGEKWHNSQQLTYLRKDLLDKYLYKTSSKLVWAIWGEREFYSKENSEREIFAKKYEDRKVYQQIIVYVR